MKKIVTLATVLMLGMAPAAFAQSTPPQPKAPSTTPAPSTTQANSGSAKFTAADANKNGTLEGSELTSFRGAMAQVDTNKDGKLSQSEFNAGVQAGHIN